MTLQTVFLRSRSRIFSTVASASSNLSRADIWLGVVASGNLEVFYY